MKWSCVWQEWYHNWEYTVYLICSREERHLGLYIHSIFTTFYRAEIRKETSIHVQRETHCVVIYVIWRMSMHQHIWVCCCKMKCDKLCNLQRFVTDWKWVTRTRVQSESELVDQQEGSWLWGSSDTFIKMILAIALRRELDGNCKTRVIYYSL